MAYYYKGDGFQVQQQTGGYNVANQAYANMPLNNPFAKALATSKSLDEREQAYRLNEANKYLLETASPYDNKTVAQKLREVGLDNWYTRHNIGTLNTNYANEIKNMTDARQRASDFNVEALKAEAYRLKSLGDPMAMREYNNMLARQISAMVANNSVTESTANALYGILDVNAAQQARASIANTYAQTRSTNASALINELQAEDTLAERESLELLKNIVDAGQRMGIQVSSPNDAARVANRLGIPQSRLMSALGSVNLSRYNSQYGKMLEGIGGLNINPNSAYAVGGGIPNMGVPASTATTVPRSTYVTTPSNFANSGAFQAESTYATPNNLVPQAGSTTTPTPTAGTVGTPAQQPQQATPPTIAETRQNVADTNARNAATVGNIASTVAAPVATANINTGTPSTAEQVNTPATARASTTESNAENFNNVASATALQTRPAIVESDTDGNSVIKLNNNDVLYDAETGVVQFNDQTVPVGNTNTFTLSKLHSDLEQLNRTAFQGNMPYMFVPDYNPETRTLRFGPSKEVQAHLDEHPEDIPKFNAMSNYLANRYAPVLANPNDFRAGFAHIMATFAPSEGVRKAYEDQYNNHIAESKNQDSLAQYDAVIASQFAPDQGLANAQNNIFNLANSANSGNRYQFVSDFFNSDTPSTFAELTNSMTATANKIDSINNTLASKRADISRVANLEVASNVLRSFGGNTTAFIQQIANNGEGIDAKTVLDSFVAQGVLIKTSPENINSENAEDTYELVNSKNAEALRTFDVIVNELEQKYPGLSEYDIQSCVFMAGLVSIRDLPQSWFTALSNTNSDFSFNAALAEENCTRMSVALSTPNGRAQYYRDKQALQAVDDTIKYVQQAQTELQTAMQNVTTSGSNLKNAGIGNRRIFNNDNTITNQVVVTSNNGASELRNGGTTVNGLSDSVNSLADSVIKYDNAVQALDEVGVSVTEQSILNKQSERAETGKVFESFRRLRGRVSPEETDAYLAAMASSGYKFVPMDAYSEPNREKRLESIFSNYTPPANTPQSTNTNTIPASALQPESKKENTAPVVNNTPVQPTVSPTTPATPATATNTAVPVVQEEPVKKTNEATANTQPSTNNTAPLNTPNNLQSGIPATTSATPTVKPAKVTNQTTAPVQTPATEAVVQQPATPTTLKEGTSKPEPVTTTTPTNVETTPSEATTPVTQNNTVESLTSKAEQGNADAQFKLGVMYMNGEGIEQNSSKAVELFTKAAEQGNTDALSGLGYMYETGQGVEQDIQKAVNLYTEAAKKGNVSAQSNLGVMYEKGKGVEQDLSKAVELYTKAAEQGYAPAQFNLGVMYEKGKGVEQNIPKAIEWYTKATKQGDGYAVAASEELTNTSNKTISKPSATQVNTANTPIAANQPAQTPADLAKGTTKEATLPTSTATSKTKTENQQVNAKQPTVTPPKEEVSTVANQTQPTQTATDLAKGTSKEVEANKNAKTDEQKAREAMSVNYNTLMEYEKSLNKKDPNQGIPITAPVPTKDVATPDDLKKGFSTKIGPFVSVTAQSNNNNVSFTEQDAQNARPLSNSGSTLQKNANESTTLTEEAVKSAKPSSMSSEKRGGLQDKSEQPSADLLKAERNSIEVVPKFLENESYEVRSEFRALSPEQQDEIIKDTRKQNRFLKDTKTKLYNTGLQINKEEAKKQLQIQKAREDVEAARQAQIEAKHVKEANVRNAHITKIPEYALDSFKNLTLKEQRNILNNSQARRKFLREVWKKRNAQTTSENNSETPSNSITENISNNPTTQPELRTATDLQNGTTSAQTAQQAVQQTVQGIQKVGEDINAIATGQQNTSTTVNNTESNTKKPLTGDDLQTGIAPSDETEITEAQIQNLTNELYKLEDVFGAIAAGKEVDTSETQPIKDTVPETQPIKDTVPETQPTSEANTESSKTNTNISYYDRYQDKKYMPLRLDTEFNISDNILSKQSMDKAIAEYPEPFDTPKEIPNLDKLGMTLPDSSKEIMELGEKANNNKKAISEFNKLANVYVPAARAIVYNYSYNTSPLNIVHKLVEQLPNDDPGMKAFMIMQYIADNHQWVGFDQMTRVGAKNGEGFQNYSTGFAYAKIAYGNNANNVMNAFALQALQSSNPIIKRYGAATLARSLPKITEENEKTTKDILNLAISLGDVDAAYTLGKYYADNAYSKKDREKAKEYLEFVKNYTKSEKQLQIVNEELKPIYKKLDSWWPW